MKILYLSMSFNQERDTLYNNLVDELLKRGYQITVVRSDFEYGNIDEISKKYKILSVKTGNPYEANLIKKGINQISLSKYFRRAIKKYLKNEEYDLILYATPPITLYKVIKFCKEKFNAKTYLMLKDIFPQNAVDLEMFPQNSLIHKYFRKEERKYYEISDYIGCMSKGNVEYLLKHNPNLDKQKVHIFYNSIRIDSNKFTSFNNDKTVFIFGGNLGKPQNIGFLLEVIKSLKGYDKAFFKIIGKGTEQNKIQEFIEENNLENLEYREYLPPLEYEEILKNADIGLISLDPRFTIPNIPSKFQSYLRQGKPVLAITDINTDIKEMILENNCGWWIEAKDIGKISKMIKRICENKKEQIEKGKNGFQYFVKEFDVVNNVEILEKIMER